MTDQQLLDALLRLQAELALSVAAVRDIADRECIDPHRLQWPGGELALAPLIAAQAQVTAALVALRPATAYDSQWEGPDE